MKKLITLTLLCIAVAAASTTAVGQTDRRDQVIDSLSRELDNVNARLNNADTRLATLEGRSRNNSVWGKGRFTRLAYAISNVSADDYGKINGSFGFSLTKGTTYGLYTWNNMLRIGLDAVWFDFNFVKLKNQLFDYDDEDDFDYGYDDEDDDDSSNMTLTLGAFGVGPNISVAPFANSANSRLAPLRASLYFHYQPAVTGLLSSYDGETSFGVAYTGMFRVGGCITYKAFSLGVESYWGSGKYDFDDDEDDYDYGYSEDYASGKTKYKFSNTRIYVGFRF